MREELIRCYRSRVRIRISAPAGWWCM